MSQPDWPVIATAMNRLNSHARSPDCSLHNYELKAPIYRYKSWLIQQALKLGFGTAEREVAVRAKCRRCVDGVYIDDYGSSRGHCYTCGGRGFVVLRFTETEVCGHRWHTPSNYWSSRFKPSVLEMPEDWNVNAPGVELSQSELVSDLNLVEQAYFEYGVPNPSHFEWYRRMFAYTLHIGIMPDVCPVCRGNVHRGAADNGIWSRQRQEPLQWTLAVHYPACESLLRKRPAVPPAELVTPAVREWLGRHRRFWPEGE